MSFLQNLIDKFIEPIIERQELYCYECGKYVQFNIDLSMEGNHVLECPNCGHEHCRVVRNGKITGDRWDSRNVQQVPIYIPSSSTTVTGSSTYDALYITYNFTGSSWSSTGYT